ncbi:MAG: hypothetical protein H7332_09635 [Bdellovibrionales bacterium]|nr:hypothetical protein [Ramlibacter sp.]
MIWSATEEGMLKVRRAVHDGYKLRAVVGFIAFEDKWAYSVAVTPPDGREVNLPTKGLKADSLEAAFAAADKLAMAYFYA